MRSLLVCLLVFVSIDAAPLWAQHHSSRRPPRQKYAPGERGDLLILRYKPQAGTLLYNLKTEVRQHVRTDHDELTATLTSDAQVALHSISIDYKTGLWAFERYFTKFGVHGSQFTGDSLRLRENYVVNKITRLKYLMTGEEVMREVVDSIRLMNTESQTNLYFFQAPRLFVPLPESAVTYGTSWEDHRIDTIPVHDTVNVGVTTGSYIYDVSRTYHLARLLDTLDQYLALIVATDSGSFAGEQSNSVTNVTIRSRGPLSGADTTFLDLFSGRVVRRTSRLSIPAVVTVGANAPFVDVLDVRSVALLDESNATKLRERETDTDATIKETEPK